MLTKATSDALQGSLCELGTTMRTGNRIKADDVEMKLVATRAICRLREIIDRFTITCGRGICQLLQQMGEFISDHKDSAVSPTCYQLLGRRNKGFIRSLDDRIGLELHAHRS